MERFTITLLPLALLSLALLPAAPAPFLGAAQASPDAPASPEPSFINATGPGGQLIYRLSNPDGLGQPRLSIRVVTPSFDEYVPLQTVFIYPNGTPLPVNVGSGSAEPDLYGDGYVYAGGHHGTHKAPPFQHIPGNYSLLRRPVLDATEAWLVVTWDRLGSGMRYDHVIQWTPGTTVELVSSTTSVRSFEMMDFRGGHRLGGPHFSAHRGDGLLIEPQGRQTYGFLGWSRTDIWSQGRFSLETDGRTWGIDYDNLTGGIEDACTCPEDGSLFFTTPSEIRADLDFIGDGRNTKLYLLTATHAAAVLPTIWKEYPDMEPRGDR